MPPAGPGGADYVENFEAASGCGGSATGLDANVSFINAANSKPFGEWARLYQHATDNDKCTENTTCAWLNSDPSLPYYYPDMAFGPGGAVVRLMRRRSLSVRSPGVSPRTTTALPPSRSALRCRPSGGSTTSSCAASWRRAATASAAGATPR
jgi:hypothetical protein